MKKLSLLLLLLATTSLAATAREWGLNINAGYVHNHLHTQRLTSNNSHNVYVGLTTNCTFFNHWLVETGLYYKRKGGELNGNFRINGIDYFNLKKIDYLHLPLMAGYHIRLTDNWSLVPKAGGYIAVAVNGEGRFGGSLANGNHFMTRTDLFDGNHGPVPFRPFHRVDAGLQFAIDAYYQRLIVSAGYDLGLARLHSTYDSKMFNRSFLIGIGIKLF